MMRHRTGRAVATVVALSSALLLATGCGVTRGAASNDMTMLIPNSPGGGYDQTGRAAVAVMENGDITGGSFEVTNVIGAGGSVAMTRLMNAKGDERTLMTAGKTHSQGPPSTFCLRDLSFLVPWRHRRS